MGKIQDIPQPSVPRYFEFNCCFCEPAWIAHHRHWTWRWLLKSLRAMGRPEFFCLSVNFIWLLELPEPGAQEVPAEHYSELRDWCSGPALAWSGVNHVVINPNILFNSSSTCQISMRLEPEIDYFLKFLLMRTLWRKSQPQRLRSQTWRPSEGAKPAAHVVTCCNSEIMESHTAFHPSLRRYLNSGLKLTVEPQQFACKRVWSKCIWFNMGKPKSKATLSMREAVRIALEEQRLGEFFLVIWAKLQVSDEYQFFLHYDLQWIDPAGPEQTTRRSRRLWRRQDSPGLTITHLHRFKVLDGQVGLWALLNRKICLVLEENCKDLLSLRGNEPFEEVLSENILADSICRQAGSFSQCAIYVWLACSLCADSRWYLWEDLACGPLEEVEVGYDYCVLWSWMPWICFLMSCRILSLLHAPFSSNHAVWRQAIHLIVFKIMTWPLFQKRLFQMVPEDFGIWLEQYCIKPTWRQLAQGLHEPPGSSSSLHWRKFWKDKQAKRQKCIDARKLRDQPGLSTGAQEDLRIMQFPKHFGRQSEREECLLNTWLPLQAWHWQAHWP